jgi:GNAT superfamily N-acetyltransferase
LFGYYLSYCSLLYQSAAQQLPSTPSIPRPEPLEKCPPGYYISSDDAKLDVAYVHQYLTASYWAKGRSRDKVARSLRGSLNFGIYQYSTEAEVEGGVVVAKQVGLGRVITDYATFAYLTDVFVDPAAQGKGLGKYLIESMLAHPDLQHVGAWMLLTKDAQGLYAPFGFAEAMHISTMIKRKPAVAAAAVAPPPAADGAAHSPQQQQ